MNKIWSGLCATTLALSFAASSAVPSVAAPMISPKAEVSSDVQPAAERWKRWDRRAERRHERREERREARRDVRDFERRGDFFYYNGHRGFRDHRPGYRYYNGYYFPSSAFIAGALITGAIAAQQAPVVRVRPNGSAPCRMVLRSLQIVPRVG